MTVICNQTGQIMTPTLMRLQGLRDADRGMPPLSTLPDYMEGYNAGKDLPPISNQLPAPDSA